MRSSETSQLTALVRAHYKIRMHFTVWLHTEEINRNGSSVSHSDLMLKFDPMPDPPGCHFAPTVPAYKRWNKSIPSRLSPSSVSLPLTAILHITHDRVDCQHNHQILESAERVTQNRAL